MGITITSKKAEKLATVVEDAQTPKLDEEVRNAADVVDEYVDSALKLKKKQDALVPLEKGVETLTDELRMIAGEQDWKLPLTMVGLDHEVELSAVPKKVTHIDKKALIKILGQDQFNELAEISIGDMRKYLNPKELEKVMTEDRQGKRTVKVRK